MSLKAGDLAYIGEDRSQIFYITEELLSGECKVSDIDNVLNKDIVNRDLLVECTEKVAFKISVKGDFKRISEDNAIRAKFSDIKTSYGSIRLTATKKEFDAFYDEFIITQSHKFKVIGIDFTSLPKNSNEISKTDA